MASENCGFQHSRRLENRFGGQSAECERRYCSGDLFRSLSYLILAREGFPQQSLTYAVRLLDQRSVCSIDEASDKLCSDPVSLGTRVHHAVTLDSSNKPGKPTRYHCAEESAQHFESGSNCWEARTRKQAYARRRSMSHWLRFAGWRKGRPHLHYPRSLRDQRPKKPVESFPADDVHIKPTYTKWY